MGAGPDPTRTHHLPRDPEFLIDIPEHVQILNAVEKARRHLKDLIMSASAALPAVLDRIDADLDKSLDRLFDFLRIPSISTDSAYKDHCRAAADIVAKDLESLGLRGRGAPDRRPSGRGRQEQRRDRQQRRPARPVLRPLRRAAGRSARSCGTRRRSSRASTRCRTAARSSSGAAPATTRARS